MPGQIGTPGQGGMPGQLSTPGQGGMPGQLGTPGPGGMPGQLGTPGPGGMPGQISTPGQGGMPGQLGTPGPGGMQGQLGAPGQVGMPGQTQFRSPLPVGPPGAMNSGPRPPGTVGAQLPQQQQQTQPQQVGLSYCLYFILFYTNIKHLKFYVTFFWV